MPRDDNVVFRCPNELKEQVRTYAESQDLSMGQVIRKALREYMGRIVGGEKKNGQA